jgi:hypothetical protein
VDDAAPTAQYLKAVDFYDQLVKQAEPEEVNGHQLLVFRGYLTHVYRTLDIPNAYYTVISSKLEKIGSVTKIITGARGVPSVLVLHHRPSMEEWRAVAPGRLKEDLTGDTEFDKLRHEIENIKRALGGLDVAGALLNIENRLQALEADE